MISRAPVSAGFSDHRRRSSASAWSVVETAGKLHPAYVELARHTHHQCNLRAHPNQPRRAEVGRGSRPYATSCRTAAASRSGLGIAEAARSGSATGSEVRSVDGAAAGKRPGARLHRGYRLVGFNVEVQPPPEITALSPDMGRPRVGTTVVITGRDSRRELGHLGGVPRPASSSIRTARSRRCTAQLDPRLRVDRGHDGAGTVKRGAFGYVSLPPTTTPPSVYCVVPS